jgi:hypothetical protein
MTFRENFSGGVVVAQAAARCVFLPPGHRGWWHSQEWAIETALRMK